MEYKLYEENQIFDCSNADNAKIGNVVVGANSLEGLMWKIKKAKNVELETDTLLRIMDNKKFLVKNGFGDGKVSILLFINLML